MPDTIIEGVLNGKLENSLLIKWLNNESIEDAPDDCVLLCCTKSDFVAYFLTYLRNQTDSILQTNSNAVQILQNATPEKLLARRKHHRSASEPTSDENTLKSDSKSQEKTQESPNRKSHESPNRDRKKTGRRVKTKLFTETSNISSDESKLNLSLDRLQLSSTPMKNGFKPEFPTTSPISRIHERCDTPRFNHRQSRSHEKSCLGDYLITATKSTKKKKKNTSDEIERVDLDLSNSEVFPEIGARKSTSLRSEKKRIKPTNIDKSQKSLSLNSFNTDSFQPFLEENSAFKQQKIQPKENSNNFETERNLLKQERHKLMEKFNVLNTPTKNTPQIRITQKESIEITQNYVKVDSTKILMKEKVDFLIEIYDVLWKNNLILSINTELYFLISILVSKQTEEEYNNVESKLLDNNIDFLLKSIHNSTYFAVKSLWNQRMILEVILDKNSLKTLGENKKVRQFAPELAKFTLNTYSLRCETRNAQQTVNYDNNNCENITFNYETDNADNFPNNQAFHLFKKQRDMFYDIIRWYQANTSSRTTFRARVKTILSGSCAANHAHLAALFVAHMLAVCASCGVKESKLSKLQRRLTAPTTTESNRLPSFNDNEMFYKEFIAHAENESFRIHLKDALSSEIVTLDATHLSIDDGGNANMDITKEYLQLAKKLSLLAKFLGYITSLPYQLAIEIAAKNNVITVANSKELFYKAPKEKVLDNNIGLRNYSQPSIDIKKLLDNSIKNNRITITVPWIANYLSMLDFTTLRLKYYNDIIKNIYKLYKNIQFDEGLKKNTVIYLKSSLGWLFDLPHFPIHQDGKDNSDEVESIDFCDVVDESTILELCPCLREVNTLLSTCRLNAEPKEMGSFRHITPVSLSVNNEDRMRNKEKELQSRLEEELLKSQPSSTRRVLEMVVERVTTAAVKDLSLQLADTRVRARETAREQLMHVHSNQIQTITQIYLQQLTTLRSEALQTFRAPLTARTREALVALLPTAPTHLHAVAARKAMTAFTSWLDDHTNTTTILCKDIVSEMRTLISMNEMNVTPGVEAGVVSCDITAPEDVFVANNISVAEPLIHLKEHICLLLDEQQTDIQTHELLSVCALSCSQTNIFCRPPARKAVMLLTVDLAVVYTSKKPQELSDTMLNQLHEIWNICCPDRKHYYPEDISLPERRDDISPELRNFDDDERMATPISDDEVKVNGDEPIASTSQPINLNSPIMKPISTSIYQSMNLTSPITSSPQQKCQPRINLQPINTKARPRNSRSQPASPMLQPITPKWVPITSKSQPVSPKLVTKPFNPKPFLRSDVKSISPRKSDSDVQESNEFLDCFNRILCPRNILLLSASKCQKGDVWEAMSKLLVFLLTNDYLSEDSLTEQCLAVYRQEWPQNILESLSSCMKSVSSKWSRSSAGKFTLFLDFLAEYCSNMDYDLIE